MRSVPKEKQRAGQLCALDPGGRYFLGFYSANPDVCGLLGRGLGQLKKLQNRCKLIAKNIVLEEKKPQPRKTRRRRYKMRRRAKQLRERSG